MAKTKLRKPTKFEIDVVVQILNEYAKNTQLKNLNIIEILETILHKEDYSI